MPAESRPTEATILMDSAAMQATLHRMAQMIAQDNMEPDQLVMLGILRRGRPLADRLAALIGEMTGHTPEVGSLATTLYRDDFLEEGRTPKVHGETHFDFSVDGRTVLLVDDVLAKGRTIRAAMGEVMDYGRPQRIQLACLIDRGGRELPIQADYLGWSIAAEPGEWVRVRLEEMDGEDIVLLMRPTADPLPGAAS